MRQFFLFLFFVLLSSSAFADSIEERFRKAREQEEREADFQKYKNLSGAQNQQMQQQQDRDLDPNFIQDRQKNRALTEMMKIYAPIDAAADQFDSIQYDSLVSVPKELVWESSMPAMITIYGKDLKGQLHDLEASQWLKISSEDDSVVQSVQGMIVPKTCKGKTNLEVRYKNLVLAVPVSIDLTLSLSKCAENKGQR